MPSPQSITEAAREILADGPLKRGLAIPHRRWGQILRKCGWPVKLRTVDVGHRHHHGGRAGDVPQPVVTVPASWLRRLAARLGVPWSVACRGLVAAEKPAPLASRRRDGRGHWPAGKRRNPDPAVGATDRLRSALAARSRRSVAATLGVDHRTVGRWATGERFPDAEHARRILDRL